MVSPGPRELWQGGSEADTRFQFEVIKELAASVRTLGEVQTRMLERLARIEEHRIHESVGELKGRVDELERERDERNGSNKALRSFLSWWGPLSWTIGILFTVFFLLARASGVLVLPTDKPKAVLIPRDPLPVEVEKPK